MAILSDCEKLLVLSEHFKLINNQELQNISQNTIIIAAYKYAKNCNVETSNVDAYNSKRAGRILLCILKLLKVIFSVSQSPYVRCLTVLSAFILGTVMENLKM